MTLLFNDALWEPSTVANPEWGGVWNASQTGRDGSANGAASVLTNTSKTLTLPSAAATCFLGSGFLVNNSNVLGSTVAPPFQFGNASGVQLSAVVNSSGFIEIRRGTGSGTLLGTTSGHTAFTVGAWFHVAFKVVLHSSTGSCQVKVNDVTVLTLTGVNTGTTGDVTTINFGNGSSSGSNRTFFDDVYVCDAVDATSPQGAPYNDYLGDVKMAVLTPAADGDSSQWTCSTGSNHAALVDESPPNTTDYVSDLTSGHLDLWTLTDLPAGATSVLSVKVCTYAAADDAGSIGIKPTVKENSTTTNQSTVTLSGTTYGMKYAPLLTRRPSDGAAWSVSDVNALQAGVKVA